MSPYIHELPDWPALTWDDARVAVPLGAARHLQGRLTGRIDACDVRVRAEAVLRALTDDVVKSGEIEGDRLDDGCVRFVLARRLGVEVSQRARHSDRHAEGAVELALDATQRYDRALTVERLCAWHTSLFPTGRSGVQPIRVGAWRDDSAGPMQVVSGPIGRGQVHFEAPAAARLDREVERFLDWFNDAAPRATSSGRVPLEPVLKAALAHLWFVTIHPFDDGNGRIARAIADMALARSEASPHRLYSMSAQIREERGDYYRMLEQTQRGTLDVTVWLAWFLACLTRAIGAAQAGLGGVLAKARYRDRLRGVPLNDRQRLVIDRLLDGFEGRMTASKWGALTRSSPETAQRDIRQLVERGVLVRNAGAGRGSYSLTPL